MSYTMHNFKPLTLVNIIMDKFMRYDPRPKSHNNS